MISEALVTHPSTNQAAHSQQMYRSRWHVNYVSTDVSNCLPFSYSINI